MAPEGVYDVIEIQRWIGVLNTILGEGPRKRNGVFIDGSDLSVKEKMAGIGRAVFEDKGVRNESLVFVTWYYGVSW